MHDSADTREALLDAAEELFSAFEVEGASMRAISVAAGLTHAAVNYHYPSKDLLLDAVLLRRGAVVSRRFGELLEQMEARERAPTAQELISAILTPHLELLRDDPTGGLRWIRITARLMLGQDPHLIQSSYVAPGLRERLWRLIHLAFPNASSALLHTSWYISVATLLQMLGNSDAWIAQAVRETGPQGLSAYVDILVKFTASGFAAVVADAVKEDKQTTRQRR
jgi:AcrR family transcriptional regulator